MRIPRLRLSFLTLALSTTALSAQEPAAWGTWRGPDMTGSVASGNPPTEWNEEDGKNIRWKLELPGKGSSSPILWGDHIFVTTAVRLDEDGKPMAEPKPGEQGQERGGGFGGQGGRRGRQRGGQGGRGRGRGRGNAPKETHDFAVLAVNRNTGEIDWQTTVHSAVPHAGTHSTGTQASNSPLTDGKHIFAHFGSHGIHCLDMTGEKIWSKQLGKMRTRNSFGEGSSPALHGDTLVISWDHEDDSFVVALDKNTGKELWRQDRDEATSWSTPLVVEVDGKPQAILAAANASRSYDLKTGKLVWSCKGMTRNVIPTPMYQDGLLYLMSGFRGAALQAIDIKGAKGDISGSDRIVWSHDRYTPYTPSGLYYDGKLYFLQTNSGVLSCLDAKKGEVHYERERLGIRSVYSSPIGVAGRVYITGRQGTTKVIKAGEKFEVIATNKLDDTVDASAAVVGDTLYIRGWHKLYCIAAPKKK